MEDYLLFQALKSDILTEESMKVIHSTPPSFPAPREANPTWVYLILQKELLKLIYECPGINIICNFCHCWVQSISPAAKDVVWCWCEVLCCESSLAPLLIGYTEKKGKVTLCWNSLFYLTVTWPVSCVTAAEGGDGSDTLNRIKDVSVGEVRKHKTYITFLNICVFTFFSWGLQNVIHKYFGL